jgi:hypothetical protein
VPHAKAVLHRDKGSYNPLTPFKTTLFTFSCVLRRYGCAAPECSTESFGVDHQRLPTIPKLLRMHTSSPGAAYKSCAIPRPFHRLLSQGRAKLLRWQRFRSWYKGGRIFEELCMDVTARAEKRAERLAWRTDFLARRTAKTEEAWNMVQDLIDAARETVRGL